MRVATPLLKIARKFSIRVALLTTSSLKVSFSKANSSDRVKGLSKDHSLPVVESNDFEPDFSEDSPEINEKPALAIPKAPLFSIFST